MKRILIKKTFSLFTIDQIKSMIESLKLKLELERKRNDDDQMDFDSEFFFLIINQSINKIMKISRKIKSIIQYFEKEKHLFCFTNFE